MTRDQAFGRLNAVQDELEAAKFCVGRVSVAVQIDSTVLQVAPYALRPAHLADCGRHLELTYLLRLYAEYEEVCRDYWAAIRPAAGGARRRTSMEVLMGRLAAVRNLSVDTLADAHRVRTYRNDVVHAHDRTGRYPFAQCRSWLATYISYLPLRW